MFLPVARRQVFLSAIWLPHNQLWVIIGGTGSVAQCLSLHFIDILLKSLWDLCNKAGSLSSVQPLVEFELGTSGSSHNALTF